MRITLVKQFFIHLKMWFFGSNQKELKIKSKIEKIWSGELKRETELELIKRYHIKKSRDPSNHYVDDTTWSDLNMDEIFNRTDRCSSSIGSQYLYHLLHKYEFDQTKLPARYNSYQLFMQDKDLREKIQKPLLHLYRDRACFVVDLLFSDMPERPWYYFLFITSSLILLCSIAAIFLKGIFIFAAIFFRSQIFLSMFSTPQELPTLFLTWLA